MVLFAIIITLLQIAEIFIDGDDANVYVFPELIMGGIRDVIFIIFIIDLTLIIIIYNLYYLIVIAIIELIFVVLISSIYIFLDKRI